MLVNTELRVIVKCLSNAVISLNYARKHECMSVFACVWMCVYYFVDYIRTVIHILRP